MTLRHALLTAVFLAGSLASAPAAEAPAAYRKAFTDPACLKMILDWGAIA